MAVGMCGVIRVIRVIRLIRDSDTAGRRGEASQFEWFALGLGEGLRDEGGEVEGGFNGVDFL